jgi:hypothetical protein
MIVSNFPVKIVRGFIQPYSEIAASVYAHHMAQTPVHYAVVMHDIMQAKLMMTCELESAALHSPDCYRTCHERPVDDRSKNHTEKRRKRGVHVTH